MLKSSSEYLQALRAGNFLLFLEWPRFIIEHYQQLNGSVGADQLIDLLIFEWLNHGYLEQDAHAVALLSKLHATLEAASLLNLEDSLGSAIFPADLNYSLATLSTVVVQCMMYHHIELQEQFLAQHIKTKEEVLELMEKYSLPLLLSDSSINIQQTKFSAWVDEITPSQLNEVLVKIRPLLILRRQMSNYLYVLENNTAPVDELRITRIGVLNRLIQYLKEHSELTSDVREQVNAYTEKIWELGPQEFEKKYLITISPLSVLGTTWRLITGLGISFFNLLEPSSDEATLLDTEFNFKQG